MRRAKILLALLALTCGISACEWDDKGGYVLRIKSVSSGGGGNPGLLVGGGGDGGNPGLSGGDNRGGRGGGGGNPG